MIFGRMRGFTLALHVCCRGGSEIRGIGLSKLKSEDLALLCTGIQAHAAYVAVHYTHVYMATACSYKILLYTHTL